MEVRALLQLQSRPGKTSTVGGSRTTEGGSSGGGCASDVHLLHAVYLGCVWPRFSAADTGTDM